MMSLKTARPLLWMTMKWTLGTHRGRLRDTPPPWASRGCAATHLLGKLTSVLLDCRYVVT